MIDDEADFASVNTKPIVSQTTMRTPPSSNGRIRELLNSFERSVYIGYTATPFANIFIYPDQDAGRHGRDLFPRDFPDQSSGSKQSCRADQGLRAARGA